MSKGDEGMKALWNSRFIRFIRRNLSKISQMGTGGLIQHGDWRCVYGDTGEKTYWMSHGDAWNCLVVQGNRNGHLEWRGDIEALAKEMK